MVKFIKGKEYYYFAEKALYLRTFFHNIHMAYSFFKDCNLLPKDLWLHCVMPFLVDGQQIMNSVFCKAMLLGSLDLQITNLYGFPTIEHRTFSDVYFECLGYMKTKEDKSLNNYFVKKKLAIAGEKKILIVIKPKSKKERGLIFYVGKFSKITDDFSWSDILQFKCELAFYTTDRRSFKFITTLLFDNFYYKNVYNIVELATTPKVTYK